MLFQFKKFCETIVIGAPELNGNKIFDPVALFDNELHEELAEVQPAGTFVKPKIITVMFAAGPMKFWTDIDSTVLTELTAGVANCM